jgi:3-oxoacyl-[acyl-carrier protein] reductase
VTLLARDTQRLRQVVEELSSAGPSPQQHEYLTADFDDPRELRNIVHDYLASRGPVHVLLNNTGGPPGGAIADADTEAFTKTFSRHLVCNHLLAQAVLPGMKESGYGRIINIVSTSVKQPIKGLGVSNTVRGAVASWAKTLAGELASFGITVNNVLPGATMTDRLREIVRSRAASAGTSEAAIEDQMRADIPAGRFAQPEEIAAAAGFLAGPTAAYITGISLPVDGGRIGCL